MIQSIHLYMQFGCLALAATIQVSDQPVDPSFGTVDSTFAFVPLLTRLTLICHWVPSTVSPLSSDCTALA